MAAGKITLEANDGKRLSLVAPEGMSADSTKVVATTEFVQTRLVDTALTGTPTAPTATAGTNSTQLATTQFVGTAIERIKPIITYMGKSGHNSHAMVVDGELYQANGTPENYTSGVYNSGTNAKYGVMNGWNNIGYPSTSPIKKVGGFTRSHAFILTEAGELFTFGYNNNGSCGLGHTTNTVHPTLAAVGVLDVYTHPSQGEYDINGNRLLILKSDGLYATGYNGQGQLGINSTTNASTFTKCTGFTNTSSEYILQVYPIANHGSTWVLTSDKKLWVTGGNAYGSHGTGNTTQHNQFVDVTASWVTAGKTLDSIKVTGGSRYYTSSDNGIKDVMVILLKYTDGTSEVKTAGNNGWGALGDATTTNRSTPVSPLNLPKDGSVVDIAGFGGSPLTVQALLNNGNLYTWGYNGEGQVGDGTTTSRSTPIIVTTGVIKLFSDGMTSHTYGFKTQSFVQKADGLYVCGSNGAAYYAGLGVSVTGNVISYAKVLLPENDNSIIDMGHSITDSNGRALLALTSKGNVYVWGYNGQNGIHTDSVNHVPIPQLIEIPRRLK